MIIFSLVLMNILIKISSSFISSVQNLYMIWYIGSRETVVLKISFFQYLITDTFDSQVMQKVDIF